MTSLRSEWFDYVRKVRKKNSKRDKPCSHTEAMKIASQTWPAVKLKLEKRRKREEKKREKEGVAPKKPKVVIEKAQKNEK